MLSLMEAQNMLFDLCSDFISFICTDLMLTEWANKGVISGIEIKDGAALYPDIIVVEILTAVNLKKSYNYSLEEIAEARKYLNLKEKNMIKNDENNLLNFINLKRIYSDKKTVIKKAIGKVNSIEKIKEMVDELYQENKKLEILSHYCLEFFKAKKEIEKLKSKSIN